MTSVDIWREKKERKERKEDESNEKGQEGRREEGRNGRGKKRVGEIKCLQTVFYSKYFSSY